MMVTRKLRRATGRYFHWCPACRELHPLPDKWSFNGNVERPSFSPSFRQHTTRGECHYTIADGQIHFYADSYHGREDIVTMPNFPTQDDQR
jgi:hypothetical protein